MKDDVYIGDAFVGTFKDFKFDWAYDKDKVIDYKVFGSSKTFTIKPINCNFTVPFLPIKKVRTEEVGVNLPGLTWLGLNGCAGIDAHKSQIPFDDLLPPRVLGHAHVCPHDPDKGMICTKEAWLYNSDGTYSDILLHETAHILTDYDMDADCGNSYESHKWNISLDKIKVAPAGDWGHGERWKEWAIKLGVAPIPTGSPPK